jgi:hypothetical protein
MRVAKLKLNPEKCVFGVTQGRVLVCLVATKGIEASPDKIKGFPKCNHRRLRKEVQKLAGHIAALNRFVAKLAHRSLPFFSVLQGFTKVGWGPE